MKHPFDRISSQPDVLNGKPCIKGTRISVSMILEWLGSGAAVEEIVARHPAIADEDVRQAILLRSPIRSE